MRQLMQPICPTCKSYKSNGGVCADGFIQGGYPTGIPQCLMDDYRDGNPHFNADGGPRYYKDTTHD